MQRCKSLLPFFLVTVLVGSALWLGCAAAPQAEMEPERAGLTIETLSRYIVSEDVELKDVSNRQALVSAEGPRAGELLSKLIGRPLPELTPYQITSARVGETPVQVSAVRHGPGPGYDLAIPTSEALVVLEQMHEAGGDLGFRIAGHRTQNIRRIEAGIPLFGIDMNESHLLLETGLENAVSFNKGCYVGQEYVARLAHRGHLACLAVLGRSCAACILPFSCRIAHA